jgi:hypothetical protein
VPTPEGAEKASRLEPIDEKPLDPFVRARDVEDCSIYWMPVSSYPMNFMQRKWLLEFHQRIAQHLKQKYELREEVFLHFKHIYPHLVDRFTETSVDYVPMAGASVTPGTPLPERLNMEGLKAQVDEATEKGTLLDVTKWMPDFLYWLSSKKPVEQRESFLGQGGMMTLFLAPDPNTKAPTIELPRYIRTSPGFATSRANLMNAEIEKAYSMRDGFLAKSKAIFGEPLREDSSYKGLMFVLPFFTAKNLTNATAEQRSSWFEVFDGYMVESPGDQGLLLVINQPDFDDELAEIVHDLKKDGHVYRG